jgi:hypothetical protein
MAIGNVPGEESNQEGDTKGVGQKCKHNGKFVTLEKGFEPIKEAHHAVFLLSFSTTHKEFSRSILA